MVPKIEPKIVAQPSHLLRVHNQDTMTPCDCLEARHTMFTWRLHHAGPELRYYMQWVAFRAAQFVDVNTGRRAHVAVVADKKVKVLQQERGETHHFFFQIYNISFKIMLRLDKV